MSHHGLSRGARQSFSGSLVDASTVATKSSEMSSHICSPQSSTAFQLEPLCDDDGRAHATSGESLVNFVPHVQLGETRISNKLRPRKTMLGRFDGWPRNPCTAVQLRSDG